MPLNLRNIRKWSFGRQFLTTANVALDNSFQDETRFIDIKDTESFSNFDLLKKNFEKNKYKDFILYYFNKEELKVCIIIKPDPELPPKIFNVIYFG